ncbi:hypothetical protein niasHS_013022 [Heterodera schachtii]|uniref:Coatomer subunit gamma C-terminal domain-containing protein n=1 Tax=Heterodera schachtii TaxID=97005 RepID=A0ABD2IIS3_HETSC
MCTHWKVPSPNCSNAPPFFPLFACGIFRGGIDVLCRVSLVMDPSDQTVSMNMVVRSMDETVSQMIANIVS